MENFSPFIPKGGERRSGTILRFPNTIVVDERWYLLENPDVAESIRKGVVASAQDHFDKDGYREGRLPFGNSDMMAGDDSPIRKAGYTWAGGGDVQRPTASGAIDGTFVPMTEKQPAPRKKSVGTRKRPGHAASQPSGEAAVTAAADPPAGRVIVADPVILIEIDPGASGGTLTAGLM